MRFHFSHINMNSWKSSTRCIPCGLQFASARRFEKHVANHRRPFRLYKAKEFLQGHQTYTRNKYVRHKFPRRKIVVPSIDYLWQVHRSINCRPKDVKPSNQFNVWMKSYEDLQKSKPSTPKFRIGQYVRIKIQTATFEKGYASTFTTDLFKIREIVNSIPVTYKLSDNTGEIILGVFYPEELSLVKI
ncbi:uncharacterized protein LOC118433089 [Folsomia candida]|uniref:uncharacterized protein LOC118433089 n=1 Tax=Folsomia candida TaxID=158441 RepID=UPI001604EC8A|nr:uncharacterized protein LOC118433089 [Folsomia candida]XP_035700577.1 uncharacterized protein LOC118433089 [Folsomia candida]